MRIQIPQLNRSVLAMAIVVGALGAAGCKAKSTVAAEDTSTAQAAPTDPPTPAATEATAPASTEDAPSMTTPLPEPPADQAEVQGPAPSPKHVWVHGYWHWAGRSYAWNPGYWEDPDLGAPSAPPALRVEIECCAKPE